MKRTMKVILTGLCVNVLAVAGKILIGIFGNSRAFLADGISSCMGVVANFVGLWGSKLAKKHANKEHPFGYGRATYLVSILIGVLTILVGGIVMYTILHSGMHQPSIYVVVASLLIIIIKSLLHHYLEYNSHKLNNPILGALADDSEHEVYITGIVLISSLVAQFAAYVKVFEYADAFASILISVVIVIFGTKTIKENVYNLLGTDLTDEDYIESVKEIIQALDGVKEVSRIDICKYGSYYKASIAIEVNKSMTIKEANEVIRNVKHSLTKSRSLRISYVIVEIMPYEVD